MFPEALPCFQKLLHYSTLPPDQQNPDAETPYIDLTPNILQATVHIAICHLGFVSISLYSFISPTSSFFLFRSFILFFSSSFLFSISSLLLFSSLFSSSLLFFSSLLLSSHSLLSIQSSSLGRRL